MALDEDRIERLENEFSVLKNQIQAVLLNVQEQVLTHYHHYGHPDDAPLHINVQAPPPVVMHDAPRSTPVTPEEEFKREEERRGTATAPSAPSAAPSAGGSAFSPGRPEEKVVVVSRKESAFSPGGREERALAPSDGESAFAPEGREGKALAPSPREAVSPLRGPVDVAAREEPMPRPLPVAAHLDVATVVGLADWAEGTAKLMGARRTREIVEIYDMVEHLVPEVKDVLLRFVSLSDGEEPEEQVAMRDMVFNMLRLDSILGRRGDAGAVLALFVGKEK